MPVAAFFCRKICKTGLPGPESRSQTPSPQRCTHCWTPSFKARRSQAMRNTSPAPGPSLGLPWGRQGNAHREELATIRPDALLLDHSRRQRSGNIVLILMAFLIGRRNPFRVQTQSFCEKLSLWATVRHADEHVVVPTNMNKSVVAFQPAPILFPQHVSNHFTDPLNREN